jgi:hypothetical protein
VLWPIQEYFLQISSGLTTYTELYQNLTLNVNPFHSAIQFHPWNALFLFGLANPLLGAGPRRPLPRRRAAPWLTTGVAFQHSSQVRHHQRAGIMARQRADLRRRAHHPADGCYQPQGDTLSKRPVIIFCFGGLRCTGMTRWLALSRPARLRHGQRRLPPGHELTDEKAKPCTARPAGRPLGSALLPPATPTASTPIRCLSPGHSAGPSSRLQQRR